MTIRRHCAAFGCGRFVRSDRQFCPRHDHAPPAAEMPQATGPPASDDRAEMFERRLADKNYRALFDANVIQVMTEAAAHLEKHGLGDEIGALRFVLARLLTEEEDLSRLAGNVSRVVSVAVQAAKAQRAISGEVAHGLIEALTKILAELEG